jgi:hypothetical protein
MKQVGFQYAKFEMPKGNPGFIGNDPLIINELTYHLYLRRSQFYNELININRIELKRKQLISFLEEKYK